MRASWDVTDVGAECVACCHPYGAHLGCRPCGPWTGPEPRLYPFRMRHVVCNGIAFYRQGGAFARAEEVVMPDGSRPAWGDEVRCGACGQLIDAALELRTEGRGDEA